MITKIVSLPFPFTANASIRVRIMIILVKRNQGRVVCEMLSVPPWFSVTPLEPSDFGCYFSYTEELIVQQAGFRLG